MRQSYGRCYVLRPAILVIGRTSTIKSPVNLCIFAKDVSTIGQIVHLWLACVIPPWNVVQSVRDSLIVEPDENHIHTNRIYFI